MVAYAIRYIRLVRLMPAGVTSYVYDTFVAIGTKAPDTIDPAIVLAA
jgi:hypothetical protein